MILSNKELNDGLNKGPTKDIVHGTREEEFSKSFDPSDQMNILKQSNIYLDPNGAYQIPNLNNLGERMNLRIDTIKNNMYSLPVLQDNNTQNKMIEGVYFVDDEGNRV
jgi:hypothetical protein